MRALYRWLLKSGSRADELGGKGKLVAGLDVELMDLPWGEFEDRVDFETDGGETPRAETLPGFQDAKVFVQCDDVDGKAHPHGVHAGGGTYEEAGAVVEGRFSEKAEQSRRKMVSESDTGADSYGLLRNGDSQILHKSPPLPPFMRSCLRCARDLPGEQNRCSEQGTHAAGTS